MRKRGEKKIKKKKGKRTTKKYILKHKKNLYSVHSIVRVKDKKKWVLTYEYAQTKHNTEKTFPVIEN